jgi:hypothetical protein
MTSARSTDNESRDRRICSIVPSSLYAGTSTDSMIDIRTAVGEERESADPDVAERTPMGHGRSPNGELGGGGPT